MEEILHHLGGIKYYVCTIQYVLKGVGVLPNISEVEHNPRAMQRIFHFF